MPDEVISRDVYEMVLRIAALPALAFLLWLSWIIINLLFNPRWRQEKRNREIRKAQAERQALLEEMREKREAAAHKHQTPGV